MSRDWLIAAGVAATTLGIIGITWWGAPARHVDHVVAAEPAVAVSVARGEPPAGVREAWVSDDAGLAAPSRGSSTVLLSDVDGVRGVHPYTGETVWSYHRDIDLCAAMQSENRSVVVFDGPAGCGEVASLNSSDGSYYATRRSIGPAEVAPLSSAQRSGVWSHQRAELWRGDLVRTVEFGENPAPQEANFQPWPECTIGDALTREYTLAVVANCPDGATRVGVQTTEPEDSRKPEMDGEFSVTGPARLVAVAKDAVAVYHDGVVSVHRPNGLRIGGFDIRAADVQPGPSRRADQVATQGHTLWFTGSELVGLRQPDLQEQLRTPAIGTGDVWDEQVLVPVAGGIAVVNWDGTVERTIAVPRPAETTRVDLRVVGSAIIEWRDGSVVGLVGL
ncbi:hypothetical protein KRX51_02725 [Corynebacterium sp. TAE3-ERU12]|uniref:Rv3212 family protein n=1 Tax=Corynebacterium sp. TAE3-ERU12 TaxID=2849491 RepID=UPI001C4575C4|nr:hypothetical protein [Corynebacterium sp. TAE3-ERU12]MBV7294836.1 hypothetical protein [Corynebacterium sp. TAE3-ERU12]